MGWLWGEKKTKIEHTQETRDHIMMNNRVIVSLEMTIRTPITRNIVYTMENTKMHFELPADTTVGEIELKKCEVIDVGA